MKTITQEQQTAMLAAQDAAAAEFWMYPPAEWQAERQAEWLERNVGSRRATGPNGLVWGELS